MPLTETPNRLINEKSPYLLQHAYNPVDWFPWSDEAFNKAQKEDKPIFLSIGYSTCHWCHVMEKESFEDAEVADILNKHFVSIKVDREERPDIDHIYMTICQAMNGQGGWPLTVIMTPDKNPFFSGTYFPKNGRRGLPGLVDILGYIQDLWTNNQEKILTVGEQIIESLRPPVNTIDKEELTETVLHNAFNQLSRSFDDTFGGFGSAPKFPTPHILGFLLRYWKVYRKEKALEMVEKTLDSMYRGGIYDHIGFGFSRYATDPKWLVPHFEKMLYDNALLALTYLEAFQATQKQFYAQAAKEILHYILRDMTSPYGPFFSAEDADSEGEEGKFYLWTPEEVKEILGNTRGENFCQYYDISLSGNFEGKSIPNLIQQKINLKDKDLFTPDREKLFQAREKRIHPFKDNKILTSWNGLMIAALAFAAHVFDDSSYCQAAEKATDFIFNQLSREDGRLIARYRDGEAAHLAYVDDYAFMTWGLIELYQATFKAEHLKKALYLAEELVRLFWDTEQGGCFFYGNDGEQLIYRPKEIYDGAIPSGNSVTALNFLRLARMTGNHRWEELASQIFQAFGHPVKNQPTAHCHLLMALHFALGPSQEIIISELLTEKDNGKMIDALRREFMPHTVILSADKALEEIVPFVKHYTPVNNKTTAYICQGFACQTPITDINEMRQRIQ
ncbi:MAG: thioredoxin domain-containing protein [Bacillota bacterium]|jgi:uncharacterized protein YyaL (SSP411 family)